ncbi:LysR family transcriptional regulator, partial [Pseudomonas aeruginosa]
MDSAVITTYLLRPAGEDSPVSVERFIARLRAHSDD